MEMIWSRKSRLLICLVVIIIIPHISTDMCSLKTVTGYVPDVWYLATIEIITKCGEDQKVVLPLEPPTKSLYCRNCSNILVIKQLEGTNVPASAFEFYINTTILDLEDLELETIAPGAFSSLNKLKELRLKGNKLQNILPDVLSSISQLEILDLSFNKFASMEHVVLEETSQIKAVNLSSNFLTKVIIDDAWNSINVLDLSNNKITNVDVLPINLSVLNISNNALTSFSIRNKLTILELESNSLTTFDCRGINYTMDKLNLRNNQISFISGKYCLIKEINLKDNKLTSIPCSCENTLSHVKYLNLANNLISDVTPHAISELSNLRTIHLESNQIKIIKVGTFAGLHQLVYLNLSHNLIQSCELGSISNINKLEEFDISYNNLTQFKRSIMHTFQNLKHLHLEYNNITYINATDLNEYLQHIWVINIVGNNFSCNNLWDIIRIFNKRPVHISLGPFKNVSNVHGMTCYLLGNSTLDDFDEYSDELDINKAISNYFNHDYRESNYYKFLTDLQSANFAVFNGTNKMIKDIGKTLNSHEMSKPNDTGVNGYLITIVLFLLIITGFMFFQVYVLYDKVRSRNNDRNRLL